MTTWGQLSFQDASSPVMTGLGMFHDHAMMLLIFIITIVASAMVALLLSSYSARNISEAQEIETIWTILPAVILVFLTLPSLRLLYLMDEVSSPYLTIHTTGHQWYWSYDYPDFKGMGFDSYMLSEQDLKMGQYRLLEVDNRLTVPAGVEMRLLATAADVIHSWAIPSAGIKIDAIPGRLNQVGFRMNYPGVFYGQCSEICGANHSFMPIALEALPMQDFKDWVINTLTPTEIETTPEKPWWKRFWSWLPGLPSRKYLWSWVPSLPGAGSDGTWYYG